MSWLTDHGWLAWIGVALALGAFEAASVDFVFLMLAGGALAGAIASAAGLSFAWQIVIAVIVAGVLLLVGRPIAKRHFMVEGDQRIGWAGQVGRSALVTQTVTSLGGRVKFEGETWSARLAPGSPECLPGQTVRVVAIEGATAIVSAAAPTGGPDRAGGKE
ncbi:MAG TPA: NfeD family protein [Segeticoccus sp.]|nr:NfeD family protein [Segeticoccus sp.]